MGAPLALKFPFDLWTVSDSHVLAFYMKQRRYSPPQGLLQWKKARKQRKGRENGDLKNLNVGGGGGGAGEGGMVASFLFPSHRLALLA